MKDLDTSVSASAKERSIAQLVEELELRVKAIKDDPTAKAAQADKVTKDQVISLRDDIAALKEVVVNTGNLVGKIWYFLLS